MNAASVDIDSFLLHAKNAPILDVRSPAEYAYAHIPGAISFPLFSDEERKQVGTAYKQESREKAIRIGLDFFGVKMRSMVEAAEKMATAYAAENEKAEKNTLLIHCWRGGMRSAAVAWLLQLYGFQVIVLQGGYKTYRHWVLQQFEKKYPLRVLGGNTGSGKTVLLHALESRGQLVIDLEGLAHHKGSAFGNLGMPAQPTQEMFENKLGMALHNASQMLMQDNTVQQAIWMEDESQRIGDVNIPMIFLKQMLAAPLFLLEIPFEERLKHIVAEYGQQDRERMVNAILRIKKRLGGLEAKNAIHALIEENIPESFRILLRYYDKQYQKAFEKRSGDAASVESIACEKVHASNAIRLLQF